MKSESQIIEYKESWRDEYLKWICGFANAQGGTLYIGVSDDKQVVGVKNAKRLMEDIPNMVKDRMGILIDVNMLESDGKEYLQLITSASPNPISFRGKYYYRTGSTLQELKGTALDQFLLSKQGRTWDSVPVPGLSARMLDAESINLFKREAARSPHSSAEDFRGKRTDLLARLHLYEGEYLKRAAALLFYSDPERYVTGAYIKIGYFANDADILYQDEIHGSLFKQMNTVIDLLTTKYMKAYIHYEGIVRVDELPVPVNALREGILNSICHKSYGLFSPIQIRVYDDHISIWNTGSLPLGWTVDTLVHTHNSMPFNPGIANVFFRAGFIESWGRGIEKVVNACKDYGCPKPEWYFDGTGLCMTIWYKHGVVPSEKQVNNTDYEVNNQIREQVVNKSRTSREQVVSKIAKEISTSNTLNHEFEEKLNFILNLFLSSSFPIALKEIALQTNISRLAVMRNYINPLLSNGILERTIPDKPNSRLQKYCLTDKGKLLLDSNK